MTIFKTRLKAKAIVTQDSYTIKVHGYATKEKVEEFVYKFLKVMYGNKGTRLNVLSACYDFIADVETSEEKKEG